MTMLALKTNSVYMLCLDRQDGLTVWINLANAKHISFDVKQTILSIAYVDGGYETFKDYDAMNLASQIRQIHAQQNLIREDFE